MMSNLNIVQLGLVCDPEFLFRSKIRRLDLLILEVFFPAYQNGQHLKFFNLHSTSTSWVATGIGILCDE
jgi:hypothetical protein